MGNVDTINQPLDTYERDAEHLRTLGAAVRELESLLSHLRTCSACYDGQGCLERHFMVKRIITDTEAARQIAHRLRPADRPDAEGGAGQEDGE